MKMHFKVIIGIIFIALIVFSVFLFMYDRRYYRSLDLSGIKSVYVNKTGEAIKLDDSSANEFLDIANSVINIINYKNDDYFNNDELEYAVSLVKGEYDSQLIYIYSRNNKKFLYAPGSGTFTISKSKYNRFLECFPTFS